MKHLFIVSEYSSGMTYNKIYKWDGMLFIYDHTEKFDQEQVQ